MICYPAAKRHHILVCVHKREEEANMAGVLEGITVLDLAQNWAGPGVSMYLADQGASVIKVEPPGGDAARGWGVSPLLTGTSKSFIAINRNKRSIALDLKEP